MLVQIHWQNTKKIEETEFVAQTEISAGDEVNAWAIEVIERRRGEIPEGWTPLLCTENSHYFVLAVAA